MAKKSRGPNPNGLVHALLYRRVSGAEHQKEGLSLIVQEQTLAEYVRRQTGWVLDAEYEDVMSGKRAARPAYQAMLTRAREPGAMQLTVMAY